MRASTEHVATLRDGRELVRIVCALEPQPSGDGDSSIWAHVMPLGTDVEARDGRRFTIENAEQVVRRTEVPLLIDWEHKSETSADTRAAGWIEALESRPTGGIWGRVRWTPQGERDVRARHYRYLSPVVIGRRAHSDGAQLFHVERLASVALTNRPALRLEALESLRAQLSEQLTSPHVPNLGGVNREALRAHGLTDHQITESARELFAPRKRGDIDRAALLARGFTEAQIDESERELCVGGWR